MCFYTGSDPHMCIPVRKRCTSHQGNRSIRFPSWRFMETESGTLRSLPDDSGQHIRDCGSSCCRSTDRSSLRRVHGEVLSCRTLQDTKTGSRPAGRDTIDSLRILRADGHSADGAEHVRRERQIAADSISPSRDHDTAYHNKRSGVQHKSGA